MNTSSTTVLDQEDLWSKILDSVKGGRGAIGTKQCIVLGASKSGKSTLVERISKGQTGSNGKEKELGQGEVVPLDLGMSYSVLEVKDDGDEETLARLSIYQLPSPHPPYPSLLPLALFKQTLLDSMIVVVLDWERPWSFVKELREWIEMLQQIVEGDKIGKDSWEAVEARERLESFVRNYHEPTTSTLNGTTATTSSIDPDAPLPSGSLTDNLGLRIMVVCTKADHINTLEREREFTEDQFDYIQQTLRTICLRYGAALFFTSQTLPTSFSKVRQYILHRLFSPSISSSALTPSTTTTSTATGTATTSSSSSSLKSFPFIGKPNVVDRDEILVPTGWDSIGKIKVLKERFDCQAVGEAWKVDFERGKNDGEEVEEEGKNVGGLQKEYEMVVVDFDAEDKPLNGTSNLVVPLDEQSFLTTHYQSLQAEVEKDPRLAFRQTGGHINGSTTHSSSRTNNHPHHGLLGPSVVGPMAGSTFDLPSVQNALDRASSTGSSGSTSTRGGGGGGERERVSASGRSALGMSMSRQNSNPSSLSGLPSSRTPSSSIPHSSTSTTPSTTTATTGVTGGGGVGAAGAAAGGNQVLADFFQSLLTARSGTNTATTGSGTSSPVPPAPPSAATGSSQAGTKTSGGGEGTNGNAR